MDSTAPTIASNPVRAWVGYDSSCPLCRATARRFARPLGRRGVALVPLQSPWMRQQLRLPESELLRELRLLTRSGEILGGADASVELARLFWWARPLVWIHRIPQGRSLLRAGYRWIAANQSLIT